MITEDASIDLEFYSESDALLKELSDIHNTTNVLLDETQQVLDSVGNSSNTTQSIINPLGFLFGLERFVIPSAHAAKPEINDEIHSELLSSKTKLADLKSQMESLKTSGNIDVDSINLLKQQLKDVINDIKSTSLKLDKSDLKSQGNNLKNSADFAEQVNDFSTPEKQNGKWHDNKSDIVTKIIDSNGQDVNLDVNYEKIHDGKFNIKISPNSNTKPGIYKIISTITVHLTQRKVSTNQAKQQNLKLLC